MPPRSAAGGASLNKIFFYIFGFARDLFLLNQGRRKFCFGFCSFRAGGGLVTIIRSDTAGGGVGGEESRRVLA